MKNNRTTWAVIGVVLVLAIGAVIAGRLVHSDKKEKTVQTQAKQSRAQTDPKNIAELKQIITTAKNAVDARYTKDTDHKTDTRTWFAEQSEAGQDLKPAGQTFVISSSSMPTLSVEPAKIMTNAAVFSSFKPDHNGPEIYNTVLDTLHEKYDFTEAAPDDVLRDHQAAELGQGYKVTDYRLISGDKTCRVSVGDYTLTMTCISQPAADELGAQYAPLVKLYADAMRIDSSALKVGPLVIRSQDKGGNGAITFSKTAGYDIAEMVVRNGKKRSDALFYAKGDTWHYVTEANDEYGFSCEPIMRDPEARKAFYDQVCYDYKNDAGQIRVDSSRRALQ